MDLKNQIWAEIDLDALQYNLNVVKSVTEKAFPIAVIKADAYGHGAVHIGKALKDMGIDFFAVSCLREALELKHKGIDAKILILGYTDPENAQILADNEISQAVYSLEYAEQLASNLGGKKLSVHIKLNTGMNRIGFDCCGDIFPCDDIIKALSFNGILFEGIFTHFAAADKSGDLLGEFTALQYNRFLNVCEQLKNRGFIAKYRHCCNSAAALVYPNMQLDAIRAGIILYGLTPDVNLKLPVKPRPVLSLKATVSTVHKIKAGDTVSYGRTFTAPKDMLLATVTAGYADGYPRFLSNCGKVIIGGEYCPIVGKVCMDQTVVDISHCKNVNAGDEAVLIGSCGDKSVTADDIAQAGGTVNYEIVCGISRRVPRIYIRNGKTVYTSDYLD